MNAGIDAVQKLAVMGYRPHLDGGNVRLRYEGQGEPDPAQVSPLLALVKAHKLEVVAHLAGAPAITCFECGHFNPTVSSPNPAQAWGHCRKRNRGRYGVALACGAVEVRN